MTHVVTLTVDELRGIIREAVSEAIGNQTADAQDEFMTFQEAADYLKISKGSLDSAGVPFTRIGAQRRYLMSDLVAFGRTDRAASLKARRMA